MKNGRRSLMRLIRDVRTVIVSVVAVGAVLSGVYRLWPMPHQVVANADEIERHQTEDYAGLKENVDAFIVEQRVAIGKQEVAADMTQEVMLRLLDRLNDQ